MNCKKYYHVSSQKYHPNFLHHTNNHQNEGEKEDAIYAYDDISLAINVTWQMIDSKYLATHPRYHSQQELCQ